MARLILTCIVVGVNISTVLSQEVASNTEDPSQLNSIQKGSAKSRTLFDYQTRIVAYKDLIETRCLLGFLKNGESFIGQLSEQPIVESLTKKFFMAENQLTKRQIWTIGGSRVVEFCRGFPTYLIHELQTNNPQDSILQNLDTDNSGVRTKRSNSHFFVGRVRGQTQSQYLNFGNSKDPGKAEAESTYGSSKAVVSGSSGMGQAQSQSIPVGCDECYDQEQKLQYGYEKPGYPGAPSRYPGQKPSELQGPDILHPGREPKLPGEYPGQRPVLPEEYPGETPTRPQRPGEGEYPGQRPELPGHLGGRPTGPLLPQEEYPGLRPGAPVEYPGGRPPGPLEPGESEYPGHRPGVTDEYPGERPGRPLRPTGPQIPGERPSISGEYPGTIPGRTDEYPGKRPGISEEYPGGPLGPTGPQIPGKTPGISGEYPGEKPGGPLTPIGPQIPGKRPGYPTVSEISEPPGQRPRGRPARPLGPDQQQQFPGQRPGVVPTYPGPQYPSQPGKQPEILTYPSYPTYPEERPTGPPDLLKPSFPSEGEVEYPGRGTSEYPMSPSYPVKPGYYERPTHSLQPGYPREPIPPEPQGPDTSYPSRGKFSGQVAGGYEQHTGHRGKFSGVFSGEYEEYQNGKLATGFPGSLDISKRPGVSYPGYPSVTEYPGERPRGPGYPIYPVQPGYPSVPGREPSYPSVPGQQPGYPGIPEQQTGYPKIPGQEPFYPGIPSYPKIPGKQPGYPSFPRQQPGYPAVPGTQPGYPEVPGRQPGYPGGPQQPGYPGGSQQPGYPGGPKQPGYPGGPDKPGYPGPSGRQPSYPGIPGQQPGYPNVPEQIGYPGISGQQPGYPGVPGLQPGYPGIPGQQPGYPGIPGQQPGYPGTPGQQPGYPGIPGQQPEYPGIPGQQPGYPDITGQQPGYPSIPGQQPGYPGIPGQQPGYPGTPGRHPGYPGIPGQQPGYPGIPGQRPGYPGISHLQPGYPEIPGQQPGYPGISGQKPGYPGVPGQQPGYPPISGTQPGYPGGPIQQPGYPGAPIPGYPEVPGRPTYPGGIPPPGTPDRPISYTTGEEGDDSDSQVQTSVQQANNGTQASASAQGRYSGGLAQSQVSGTYSGSGSFSASAGSDDGKRGALSQVSGGAEGAMSSAQGRGGLGQSQAQVQLASETGDTISSAQTGGHNHGSQTQVQASGKGGMADAQANGPGSTSSQAQIGFTPYDENEQDNQSTPFRGGGTASAQSGTYSGQAQSQIQGKFQYGIKYTGAAQAGSGGSGSSVRNQTRLAGSFPEFKPLNFTGGKPKFNTQSQTIQNNENRKSVHKTMRDSIQPRPEESTVQDSETEEAATEEYQDYDEYDTDFTTAKPRTKSIITQSLKNQRQHIVLDPLEDLDATVQQSYGSYPADRTILQPGEYVPGSTGYQIPPGFRGRVKSVANGQNTYSTGKHSQAQSVTLTPGNGRIIYKKPIYAVSSNTHFRNGHIGFGSGYTYQPVSYQLKSGKSLPNFVSLTKSETGSTNPYTGQKTPKVYYTQSSSCGVFTNTCVFNRGEKLCIPKPKTNPDGSFVSC